MDIRVNNLDLGYEQCEGLNNLVNGKGQELTNNIKNNIANLKQHWVGNDATVHINNLIELYDFLGRLVNGALGVTSSAADSMIRIQEIRQLNGGAGQIGNKLISSADFSRIANAETTAEYYVDPAALSDLSTLKGIYSSYNEFINSFKSKRDDLFSNWTMGARIEQAKEMFDEFLNASNKYDGYFNNAIENLEKATKNISNL